MTRYEMILDALSEADGWEKLEAWNEYCQNNYYDEEVFSMDLFDEMLDGLSPSQVLDSVCLDDFSLNDDYFYSTVYGYKSFRYIEDAPICDNDLAQYMDNNEDALEIDEIQEILDEYDEDGNKLDDDDEDEDEDGEALTPNAYNYAVLFRRATRDGATQEDVDTLGDWFSIYGITYWDGERFIVDELESLYLYPIYDYDETRVDDNGDYLPIGYSFERQAL